MNRSPLEPSASQRGRVFRALLSSLLAWPVASSATHQTHDLPAYGPAFHVFPLTLAPGERTEIAGPLLSFETRESANSWGIHPFFYFENDPVTDLTEFDFLYPLITWNRFGTESRFQILQVISFSGGVRQATDQKRKQINLFPFYFQQRSADPDLNYTAFFPFFGHLKNRMLRDEIRFVLFPLYAQTRKRDVVTANYLYPFFHWREGNGLQGWQFWPLAGHEVKQITTRTNSFEEIETISGHDKRFVLWPFFFKTRTDLGTQNPKNLDAFLPLYSLQRSPLRESTSIPWPLGVTYTVDREKNYTEWGAPWPLIVFARGEGKHVNRIWPLFGRAKNPILQSDFYLWPIYKYNRAQADPLDRERTRILLFLYSDLIERNTATGTALERTDLWPLFTARRDHDGRERLQILAPLEPILPNNRSIERNYSPIWSIWRSESNPKTGVRSRSFLWNLYRFQESHESRKCSILFGLFHYQSGPNGKRWRLFYIPIGARLKQGSAEPVVERHKNGT